MAAPEEPHYLDEEGLDVPTSYPGRETQPILEVNIVNHRAILAEAEAVKRDAALNPDYPYRGPGDLMCKRGMLAVSRMYDDDGSENLNPNDIQTTCFCSPAGMSAKIPFRFAGQIKVGADLTKQQSRDMTVTIWGAITSQNTTGELVRYGDTLYIDNPDKVFLDGKIKPASELKSMPGFWLYQLRILKQKDLTLTVVTLALDVLDYIEKKGTIGVTELEELRKMAQARPQPPCGYQGRLSPLERLVEALASVAATPDAKATMAWQPSHSSAVDFALGEPDRQALRRMREDLTVSRDDLNRDDDDDDDGQPALKRGKKSSSGSEQIDFIICLLTVAAEYRAAFGPVIVGKALNTANPYARLDILAGCHDA